MPRRPPRSTLFPYTRSSDLDRWQTCLTVARMLMLVGPKNEDLKLSYLKILIENGLPKPTSMSIDRKSTRLNSSHPSISYAVFCLKKKIQRYTRESGVRNLER